MSLSSFARAATLVGTLSVALPACESSWGPRTSDSGRGVSGTWSGVANGVRVQLSIVESTKPDPTFGNYQAVEGTGSLTVLATGATLPFVASGFHQSGPTGVLINIQAPRAQPSADTKWYGHFLGEQSSAGELTGRIDGTVQNTIGPLQGLSIPVTLIRQ